MPLKVEQHRHHQAHGPVVKGGEHLAEGTRLKFQVGVEHGQCLALACVLSTNVDAAGIAEIGAGLDADHFRAMAHPFDGVIGRAIVHDDDLQCETGSGSWQGIQQANDITRAVVRDDNDRAVNVVLLVWFSHGCLSSCPRVLC